MTPATAGTYAYTVTGTSSSSPVPSSASLTISAAANGTQSFDLTSGNSQEIETLSFRADGVYLVSLHIIAKQPPFPAFDETLTPGSGPVRVIPTSSHTSPSSVTFTVASSDASATIMFTVHGLTTANVAGSTLPALHYTLTSSDLSGTIAGFAYKNGSFSVDALVSPTNALPYRQQTRSSITVAGQTVSSNITATLTSLHG